MRSLCFLFFALHSLYGKTEVKYLIPNLSEIPSDILESLQNGDPHPEILRRGFVVQEYLAVTHKNVAKIHQLLTAAEIPFTPSPWLSSLLLPNKIQEIRLMRKSLLEKGKIREIYQIGMQGPGKSSNIKTETPETLDERELQKIKQIFDAFRSEVNHTVYKLHFEITAKDKENRPVQNPSRTVEVDIFLKNLTPFFIDGEIKFRNEAALATFRNTSSLHPSYFGIDVTDHQRSKARNLAIAGESDEIRAYFQKHAASNQLLVSAIAEQFLQWASPEIASLFFHPPQDLQSVFCHKKVLLNAEPFGFGPTAAIAEIFPYLKNHVSQLSYIGMGHTLDVQRELPYDHVYDYEGKKERFLALAKDYDVFITASDFETAKWAKELGLKLVLYDPLCWYWPKIPEIVARADLYIAQNFFGVAERLQLESELFPSAHTTVPAVLSGLYEVAQKSPTKTLLINIGGLSNPYMRQADLESFAKVIFRSMEKISEPPFDQKIYVTNQSIASAVQDICPAKVLQPSQVQKILSESTLAVMTSGLGNLFEASSMEKKVVWLPPANDSQGQQIRILQEHKMIDSFIDWSDLFEEEEPIDYFAPQQQVLKQISSCMQRLAKSPDAQAKFASLLCDALEKLQKEEPCALSQLALAFGTQGGKQAVENILQWLAIQKEPMRNPD